MLNGLRKFLLRKRKRFPIRPEDAISSFSEQPGRVMATSVDRTFFGVSLQSFTQVSSVKEAIAPRVIALRNRDGKPPTAKEVGDLFGITPDSYELLNTAIDEICRENPPPPPRRQILPKEILSDLQSGVHTEIWTKKFLDGESTRPESLAENFDFRSAITSVAFSALLAQQQARQNVLSALSQQQASATQPNALGRAYGQETSLTSLLGGAQ